MRERDLSKVIKHASKGDPESFAKLYAIYSPAIYHLGLKLTKNEHDANDVVQETMLKVHKSLPTLRDHKAIKSFINKVAYHCAIDILRDKKGELFEKSDEIMAQIPEQATEFVPEQYMETKERREFVLHLVEELSVEQRSAIVLFYYEELSIKEIAELQNVSEGVVKARLFRGRTTLKDKLSRSNVKGVVAIIASIPILTQIFKLEAKAKDYDKEQSATNWRRVAQSLGYSGEVVAATTAVATANYVATSVTTGVVTGKAVALIAASAVALSAGGYYTYQKTREPVTQNLHMVNENTQVKEEAALVMEAPNKEVLLQQEPSKEGANQEENANKTEQLPNIIVPTEPSEPKVDENGLILLEKHILPYPVGKTVSKETIIHDARISLVGSGDIVLKYYEQIDFKVSGEYAILAELIHKNGTVLGQVVLVIIVK